MNNGDTEWRLFFAVAPDEPTRARLASAAGNLQLPPGSRLIPPANYHLTLAFLGGVPPSRLASVLEVGRAQRSAEFSLHFDAYEYWPKPEVVIAAARSIPSELQRLWHSLHDALAPHALASTPKRLRPHVTLAKKVAQAPVLQALSGIAWRVTEICLMRSETRDEHPSYTVVDTWPLLDNAENP